MGATIHAWSRNRPVAARICSRACSGPVAIGSPSEPDTKLIFLVDFWLTRTFPTAGPRNALCSCAVSPRSRSDRSGGPGQPGPGEPAGHRCVRLRIERSTLEHPPGRVDRPLDLNAASVAELHRQLVDDPAQFRSGIHAGKIDGSTVRPDEANRRVTPEP